MNLTKALQEYLSKMLKTPGMKVLLLDKETTGIIAMVSSQTEIIKKQVFLVQRCDGEPNGEQPANMEHLNAVVFVRPTPASINAIKRMLKNPKYKEYHLFFSNLVTPDQLKAIAEADTHELVRQVQEYFADYYVMEDTLFHCNQPLVRCLEQPRSYWTGPDRDIYERGVTSLLSCLLSLKKRPVIRYQGSSELAKMMAVDITQRMKEESDLFHTQGECTLLLLDRRDDPVTPLLQQWTYQAMVHELLGIHNNRVDLSGVPGIKKELMEVVLSSQQDEFYSKSMHLNFGELGASVKGLVQDYQKQTKDNSKMDSIEDMQRFVDNYPEFRQMSGNVSKHVSVMTELSRLVELRGLLRVSELEQELACNQDHGTALENLLEIVNDSKIRFDEKLRLCMLYALRYEQERNELATLKSLLHDKAHTDADRQKIPAVDAVLKYGGAQIRGGDLFSNKSFLSKAKGFLSTGIKGVENIYTRHRPLLASTLDQLLKGKLKAINYPFVDVRSSQNNKRVQQVIVFVMGGVTYEESNAVAAMNANDSETSVVLGGSFVHNTKTFVDDLLSRSR